MTLVLMLLHISKKLIVLLQVEAGIINSSCFGFRGTGGGDGYLFFCYAPPKYCNALAHYKKTGTLQKTGGRITKKQKNTN